MTHKVADPHFPNIVGEGDKPEEALKDLNDQRDAILNAIGAALDRLNDMPVGLPPTADEEDK